MWLIIIGSLLLIIAAVGVSYPLFAEPLEPLFFEEVTEDHFSEKDALLESMSDLEYAYKTGKISEQVYTEQKSSLHHEYVTLVEEEEKDR